MKIAVPIFPGSSGERDIIYAIEEVLQESVTPVWHQEKELNQFDAILIPGGSSYGDYLRPGALARYSPVMESIAKEAEKGKLILGIGNGFQILQEAGLLPGTLLRNKQLHFCCELTTLVVEQTETPFTNRYKNGEVISIPIAHQQGNFFCDERTLAELKENNQIIFRYQKNPNGSIGDIAGVCNKKRNVLGMMPHPERAIADWMGTADGAKVFISMLQHWKENGHAA